LSLQRALEEQKKQNQQEVAQIAGLLGIPLSGQRRVEVPNRNSYVFVRLRSNTSEVIQAYNNQVAPAYDLPVIVERHGNKYIVAGVDSGRYENNWASQSPFLPRHGNTHTFDLEMGGGGDVVWVQSPQFVPSLVFPSGSVGGSNVIVHPYTIRNSDGTWKYVGNTGTSSLAPYRPTSPTGAIMALVYLDTDTGNPQLLINSGSVFSNSITGSSQIVSYIPRITNPGRDIPLAAIRLITGTNVISWNHIYDVRQWLHTIPTGSAGGGGGVGIQGIPVQDEGVFVATGSVLNFVGDNISATVSGSVIRVYVTGSASGGGINTGTLDARYLKLDTSNDPLVGNLRVSGSIEIYTEESHPDTPLTIGSERGGTLLYGYQQYHDSGGIGSPAILLERYPFGTENAVVSAPFLKIDESRVSGSINGQLLTHTVDGVERTSLYPNATGTLSNYKFDTTRPRPTGTIHTEWMVSGSSVANLLPDGIFQSRGYPLAWSLIEDKNLAATTASFDFQNIPAIFKHLKIELYGRSGLAAATSDGVKMTMNNDSGNNYVGQIQWGGPSPGWTQQGTAGAPIEISYVGAANTPAGWFSNSEITIFNYANANAFKSFQARGMQLVASGGNVWVYDAAGAWLSNTAVNRVTIYLTAGSFVQYSRATLYGLG
jgi:hypothetical protein